MARYQVEDLLHSLVEERGKREKLTVGAAEGKKKKKKCEKDSAAADGKTDETPDLKNVDRYIEMMYDEPETATQATYMILQLARSPENLEQLLENEALLGLLARLLQVRTTRDLPERPDWAGL